jgi:hypothetical protein
MFLNKVARTHLRTHGWQKTRGQWQMVARRAANNSGASSPLKLFEFLYFRSAQPVTAIWTRYNAVSGLSGWKLHIELGAGVELCAALQHISICNSFALCSILNLEVTSQCFFTALTQCLDVNRGNYKWGTKMDQEKTKEIFSIGFWYGGDFGSNTLMVSASKYF